MNSFTVTIDRTLIELEDAYRKHFNLPFDQKIIKSDIGKMVSQLAEVDIDLLNDSNEDDGSIEYRNN